MTNKINIENKELLVLMEFNDDEYEKIIICLDENNQKVFVINNKVITDNNIINAINKKYDLNTYIKKPNDIYINNKKLAGILIETKYLENKLLYVIIGIGINVNQKKFPQDINTIATSIFLETGKTFDIYEVLNYINDKFYKEFILKE